MRLVAENWEPLHDGGSLAPEADPPGSDAVVNLDVEVPADQWAPVGPTPGSPAGSVVFVDGVQRIETWLTAVDDDDPERSFIAVAASMAAGALRADADAALHLERFEVDRGLFSATQMPELDCAGVAFRPIVVADATPAQLRSQVTAYMRQLEAKLAATLEPADLMLLDGPLTGTGFTPGAVGFIKSHHRVYLPPEQQRMLGDLKPGERSPLFVTQANFSKYAWYLRLPGGNDYPLSGVVRLECAGDTERARHLADLSTRSLPRFASKAHRDGRAPNNLTPIGSLEHQLRHRLSDAAVVSRRVRAALARHSS